MSSSDESVGAYIVRHMSAIGFQPNPGFGASNIRFFKDYAEGPRVSRVTVFFDKPITGMSTVRLANIVVSTQYCFAPEQEAIDASAPAEAREDLTAVIETLSDLVGLIPKQAVMTRECIRCEQEAAEFFIVNDDAICVPCCEERRRESTQ